MPTSDAGPSGQSTRNIESILEIEREDKANPLFHHLIFRTVGRFGYWSAASLPARVEHVLQFAVEELDPFALFN